MPFKFSRFVAVVLSLIVSVGASGAALALELSLGYGAHVNKPYVAFENGRLVGGWIHATSRALSQELGIHVRPVSTPRKRYGRMLDAGELDVYCFTNPAWLRDVKNVVWSPELFSVRNVVIANKSKAAELQDAEDLKGLNVGTILGYSYRPLEQMFREERINRIDNNDFRQNLLMLNAGRADVSIVPGYIARELLAELKMTGRFKEAPYVVSRRSLHCAVSTSSRLDPQGIVSAFSTLVKKGRFDWENTSNTSDN